MRRKQSIKAKVADISVTNSPEHKSDPIELLAELLHIGWLQWKLDQGCVWGPRGSGEKPHPHIIAWSQKESWERNQDRFQTAIILNLWAKGRISSKKDVTRMIHQTWGAWMNISDNPKKKSDHAKRYKLVHKKDRGREHRDQAKVVWRFLKSVPKFKQPTYWD